MQRRGRGAGGRPPGTSRRWWAAGLLVYAGAAWGGYTFFDAQRRPEEDDDGGEDGGVWERLAAGYDIAIDRDERVTGIAHRRAALLTTHAHGHVLEVACGTGTIPDDSIHPRPNTSDRQSFGWRRPSGRNLLLYPMDAVTRVTATDASPAMLEQARAKLMELGWIRVRILVACKSDDG